VAVALAPLAGQVEAAEVPPLDCTPGKVCREPKTFLPSRVLTRPFSHIYKTKDTSRGSILSENITAFTPLYIFAREDLDFSDPKDTKGWYQVGETAAGNPVGWMQAKDVVEWRQTLIVVFSHPGVGKEARKSVILFETLDALNGLTSLEDSARKAKADELYQSIQAAVDKRGAAPDGVVSVEPGPFIDIKEKFYMLPVLQFEDLGSRFADESHQLQVVAVAQNRRETSEPALPQQAITDAPVVVQDLAALQKLGVDIVFVMDMTASMAPYIQNATQAVGDIARLITQDPETAKSVRFGFVGYRDDVKKMPYLDFTAKNFTPNGLLEVGEFLNVMGTVNPMMATFAAEGRGSGDYQEEMYAGLREALSTKWSDPSLRFIVLVGDASSHEVGHEQNTTGLDAPTTRQQLNADKINVLALHLRDERAAPDHALAQQQFTTLATNEGGGQPYYYSVKAADTTGYNQAVKDIGTGLTEVLAKLRKGDVKAVMAAAQATSVPSAGGEPGAAAIKTDVAKLGAAAVMPYLGKEATPPRDIVAWAFDRDLVEPRLPALQARVLLNREQVNDLVFTAEKVSQTLKRAQLTQMQFFEALQSVTLVGVKGQDIDYGKVEQLRGSGIAASWLETLPYKSEILTLNNDLYASMSPDERSKIEKGLDARLENYRNLLANSDIWVKLSDRAPDDDKVYPLELVSLP
jgi:serine/threonine-protein kinase PpkA